MAFVRINDRLSVNSNNIEAVLLNKNEECVSIRLVSGEEYLVRVPNGYRMPLGALYNAVVLILQNCENKCNPDKSIIEYACEYIGVREQDLE